MTQPADARPAAPEHRWLILGVIALAQLMIVLDATVMNIALPTAQRDLGFTVVDRQWVVTAYALAFGSLLLLGGKLADLLGRKVTFLVGLIGFAVASALGGAAVNFAMLVAARACQGAFGALLAPSALSLLTVTFTDPKERGKAFGVYGAIAGAGGAIGLLLGGILTEYLSWRWCLYVNLIFAAIAVAGAVDPAAPPGRAGNGPGWTCPARRWSPAACSASSTASPTPPCTAGTSPPPGASSPPGWCLLAGFAWRQTRAPAAAAAAADRAGPQPRRRLPDRCSSPAPACSASSCSSPTTCSRPWASRPWSTGLAFLPMIACLMVGLDHLSNIVLMPRIGPRPLAPAGLLLAAAGLALLTRIGVHSSYATAVLPPLLIIGTGFGLVFAPVFNTGTFGVAPQDAGVASATVNTGQQLGGSIGTSLLNTIFASTVASYVAAHLSPATAVHGRPSQQLTGLALVHGYTTAFWWSAAILTLGAIVAVTLFRNGPLTQPAGPAHGTGTSTAADQDAPRRPALP